MCNKDCRKCKYGSKSYESGFIYCIKGLKDFGSKIKDSGERQLFKSGAVRDVSEGKGRCDLLPLSVIAKLMKDKILTYASYFQKTREIKYLYQVLEEAMKEDKPYMVLELSKHFEKGAEKYDERNWEKGIPVNRYIDSGVRHYLKYLDAQEDEPHFIAFIWNISCLIWTIENLGDDE